MSNRFLRRLGLGAFALVLTAGIVVAANMSFSTGAHFLPGFRQVDGTDLNVIVDNVNTLNAGTINSNALIGSGVNKVSVAGGATTVDPIITVGGASSDTNIGLLIAGKGTGPVHLGGTTKNNGSVRIPTVASAVNAIDLEGAITSGIPFITVGGLVADTNAAIAVYGKGTGNVLIGGGTTTLAGLQVAQASNRVNDVIVSPGATGTIPSITSATAGADANIGIAIAGNGTGNVLLGGVTSTLAGLQVAQTASAVNDLVVTNGATGTAASISAASAGSDTNIGMALVPKGTGAILIGGSTTTLAGLQIAATASRVNDFVLTPNATGTAPVFEAGGAGADASVGATFGTVGTGAIAFDTDTTVQQFGIGRTATAVDYLSCAGAATANPALVTCTATGSDTNVNIVLASKAAGNVKLGTSTVSTCSGTTTATCQGQRFIVSITGLTTAASTLSAAMTVTNANVVSNASTVLCQVNLYAGTGVPIAVNVTPGNGTVALNIQNVSTAAALNATVPIACVVFGT